MYMERTYIQAVAGSLVTPETDVSGATLFPALQCELKVQNQPVEYWMIGSLRELDG
jgi:hypothetical protein